MSTRNSSAESLMLGVMVLGGRASGGCLGHEAERSGKGLVLL